MKRFLTSITVLLGLALAVPTAHSADTIKIELMAPITGAFASEGKDMRAMVELLAEELNKKGALTAPLWKLWWKMTATTHRRQRRKPPCFQRREPGYWHLRFCGN